MSSVTPGDVENALWSFALAAHLATVGTVATVMLVCVTAGLAVSYALAFSLLLIVPGPDFALVTRNAVGHGRVAGVATAVGVGCGHAVLAVTVALGLGAVVAASTTIFTSLKLIGAAYLGFLGIASLYSAFRRREPTAVASSPDATEEQSSKQATNRSVMRRSMRDGLLSNVFNPKALVVYLALMPQFVPQDAHVGATLVLSVITVAMTTIWFGALAVGLAAGGGFIRKNAVRRALDAVTGAALLAFGVRLAAGNQ